MYDNMLQDNLVLKKIIFRQIGRGYDEQYSRPFEIAGNKQTVDAAVNAICEGWMVGAVQNNANGLRFTSAPVDAVSGISGQLIAPSPEAYSANIGLRSNAWGDDRFVFWATFETTDNVLAGQFFRYIVTGYTDSDDELGFARQSGSLDPNMRMFVNTIHKLEIKLFSDGYGGVVERCTVIHHDEVHFNGQSDIDLRNNRRSNDCIARPTDILDMCQLLDGMGSTTANTDPYDNYGIANETHIGAVSGKLGYANNKVVLARTDNHSSATMISNLLNGIGASRAEVDRQNAASRIEQRHFADGVDNKVYARARSTPWIRESHATLNGQAIMHLFKEVLHLKDHPFIGYSDFLRVFPNADPRYNECEVSLMSPYEMDDKSSMNMRGATKEGIEAYRISCALSNIMLTNGFYEIAFIATNQTVNGLWDISPIVSEGREVKNMRTTDTDAINLAFDAFCNELLAKVLIPAATVTGGYTRDISLVVGADLMTDIRGDISIDGGLPERFVFTTFASNAISPLRYRHTAGENPVRLLNTSRVISQLSEAVFETQESVNYRASDRTLTGDRTRPNPHPY